jgi:hypothetical protein
MKDPEVPLNTRPGQGKKSEAPKELHTKKEGYHEHNSGYTSYHGEPLGSATCEQGHGMAKGK